MGLMDGLIGGVVGAGLSTVISAFIEKQGGVANIVSQFQQHGLGETVASWVGTGANQAISAEKIQQVVGSDTIKQFAEKFGIPQEQIAEKIAEYLPQVIDKLTPDGKIPTTQAAA